MTKKLINSIDIEGLKRAVDNIYSAFLWRLTEQGYDYWAEVINNLTKIRELKETEENEETKCPCCGCNLNLKLEAKK